MILWKTYIVPIMDVPARSSGADQNGFDPAFIRHPFLRQTVKDIEMNIAYRWFLGYTLNETIPHFATVSYNFRHRFKESVIEDIFTWILYEVERAGYLKPEVVFVDATHIKA